MKTRLILIVSLVAVLVLVSAVGAYAGSGGRITGGMKAEYPPGWSWLQVNVDVSPSGESSGFIKYKSWTESPNLWDYWRAEPVCVSFGEFQGLPAATIVQVFTDDSMVEWIGKYATGIFVDGGPNATNDLLGMVVWPPQDDQPDCEFADPFYWWPGVGGNITIHDR